MIILLGGIVVLIATVMMFIYLLPRGGKVYRLADTEYEPYVGVAFCSATALGLTMTLSAILDMMS
jgi:tellurite resistance protein TehA-like permease